MMLLYLSIAGLVLSAILLYNNSRKFETAIFLGSFFFLISLYSFIQYVIFYSNSVFLISILYINFAFLTYLIGPSLYWYVRSVLNDSSRFKKRDFLHLAPAIIFFLTALPYLFSPWSEKVNNATEILNDVGYLGTYKATPLYNILPNAAIYLSRPVLALAYTLWCGWILARYISAKKRTSVFSHQRYMIKWLIVLLGFMAILSLSQLLSVNEAFADQDSRLFFTYNLLMVSSAAGLTGLLISPYFFPGILYGLPRFPDIKENENVKNLNESISGRPVKVKIHDFEDEYLELIRQKVDALMYGRQAYLKSDCNLNGISKLTGLPANHLAYYFLEIRQQGFDDFCGRLRVDHAKKLIRERSANEMTLDSIGLASGFSSKSAFFRTFKKIEGISPAVYMVNYSA